MRKLTSEEFIERANIIHKNKYDYSLVNYINARTKVKIICPIHGVFSQSAGSHLHGCGCPACAYIRRHGKHNYVANRRPWIDKDSFIKRSIRL